MKVKLNTGHFVELTASLIVDRIGIEDDFKIKKWKKELIEEERKVIREKAINDRNEKSKKMTEKEKEEQVREEIKRQKEERDSIDEKNTEEKMKNDSFFSRFIPGKKG